MDPEARLSQRSLSAGVYSSASSRLSPMMLRKCLLRELTASPDGLSRTGWAGSNYYLAGSGKSKQTKRW